MHSEARLTRVVSAALICALLTGASVAAQDGDAAKRETESRQTNQAQAVRKEVYDEIQKAQEMIDGRDYNSALRSLNNLYNPEKLTEYEQANVLNFIGFVYYNMDDIDNAIQTYERMLVIPTLEPQMAKQTMYTLSQLYTMKKQYAKALSTLEHWFLLETNPAPEAFILKAQHLYSLQRYREMIRPIENAMRVAQGRGNPIKEDWYVLLNFAYFKQENYAKVRDIQRILLENWPKERYLISLAGAYAELGDDGALIELYEEALNRMELEDSTRKQIVDHLAALKNSGMPASGAIRVRERRFALVIGNGAYKGIDPLRNPPRDVVLVSQALESAGFKVTTLIDSDMESMDEAVNKFVDALDEAGDNTVGLFYYAGHGVSYSGANWLIPIDAEISRATHLKHRTLSANYVLELMEEAQNATDIMILDACRNSPYRGFSLSGTRAVTQGMRRMEIAPAGSFIAYSTAPGMVAYDGSGAYSTFAEAFADEVTNTTESIGDMMIDVRVRVKESTEDLEKGPQIPWTSSSLLGKFWFNPEKSATHTREPVLTDN